MAGVLSFVAAGTSKTTSCGEYESGVGLAVIRSLSVKATSTPSGDLLLWHPAKDRFPMLPVSSEAVRVNLYLRGMVLLLTSFK